MGLWSPETRAYSVPILGVSRQVAEAAVGGVAARSRRSPPPPRRSRLRYVETPRQTSSPATDPTSTTSSCRPRSCGRRFSAYAEKSSRSPVWTGRRTVIRFATCTTPVTGTGNSGAVISRSASGKPITCGYVAGSRSARRNPQTRS